MTSEVVAELDSGSDELDRLAVAWPAAAPYLALFTAWIATAGSLYFSEWRGFVPCALCWYQRIFMYPLAILVPIALMRRQRDMHVYVLPFTLIGGAIATYHYLLQKTDLFDKAAGACRLGVPCSSFYINWFGFVTIPFLALSAFLMIALSVSAARREPDLWAGSEARPVAGITLVLVAVIVLFAAIFAFGPAKALPVT